MQASAFIGIILGYFALLFVLAWVTSRGANNESFFIGNRKSNWLLVAFGMVGTALSGVTFISVPGTVGANGFGYMQVVIGNFIGYMIVAGVLLPLYYRLNLTSIYDYLGRRFGVAAHKVGASFFILSRTLGATARLYLVTNVLHLLVTQPAGIPFWVTAAVILLMIWLYTFKGGVKTIVFTDTLQTACMLGGLVICIYFVASLLGKPVTTLMSDIAHTPLTNLWNTDVNAANFWLKQVIGGAFIAVAMLGLDQEMMQKNISVPRLWDSQKNMFVFSAVLIFVAQANQVVAPGDTLFPTIVMQYFPAWVQIIFFLALISALFPSADGALTALTSSFCIDILGLKSKPEMSEATVTRIRQVTHIAFAVLFFVIVMIFKWINDRSIIDVILKLAGYTYGPLLGLFAFGLLTTRVLQSAPAIIGASIAAPLACYLLQTTLAKNPGGYQIGIELLLINGTLTFLLLWVFSKPKGSWPEEARG
jgi:Na+/proline symporter